MKQYLAPLIRWWWLILLCTGLAAVSSVLSVWRLPPQYQVKATLIAGRSFNSTNPSSNDIFLEQQLAGFYANIGNQEQVASATMKALGLNFLPQ